MELGSKFVEVTLANDVVADVVEDAEVVVEDMSGTATVTVIAYHDNDVEDASAQQAVEVEPDAVVVDRLETYMAKMRISDFDHGAKEWTSSNSSEGSRMDFEPANEDVVVWDN